EQVVRERDGVEVAGEVQVDVLHRHDLRVPAAGGAALHAEHRPQRGLAQADHRLLADVIQRVAEADRGGGLALAGRAGADGGDQDELCVRPGLQAVQVVERDLRLVVPVGLEVLLGDTELRLRDLGDAFEFGFLGDFDIRGHRLAPAAGQLSVLGGRHYKGCPNSRTLTEVKTKNPAGGVSSGLQRCDQLAAASACPPPKLICSGTEPPLVTFTAQYLNSGILPKGSSTGLVSVFAAAS